MKINTAIREARTKSGLTQVEAANKIGIAERVYQHYEAGTRVPNAYTASKLAKVLCTTVEELFAVAPDGHLSPQ